MGFVIDQACAEDEDDDEDDEYEENSRYDLKDSFVDSQEYSHDGK
jgi:hypothetical protein